MRLIDVDAFKADYGMKDDCAECDKEVRGKSKSCEFDRVYTKMDFCGWLDYAPTIEERKTGKWEIAYLDHVSIGTRPKVLYCSECNQCIAYPTNYCPNCGAKMS